MPFETHTTMEFREGKHILRNVRFMRTLDFSTERPPKFTSSEPGRKIAILDFGETEPDLTKSYDVEVVRDTKFLDPSRGAFIVKYIREPSAVAPESTTVPRAPGVVKPEEEPPMEDKTKEGKPYIPLPVERDELTQKVYVLETEIPLNTQVGEFVPHPERFRHFTLDQRTLETLEKIATAVELREPCLLEGETSTSKTSAIEYLAMVSGNEVVRLNLNGQTDTSELVGKFVPNDGQLQISFEQLLRSIEAMSDVSKSVLQKANLEGRGLTLVESQQIAQAEGLKVPDWRWQDGLDIQAKKKGQWLILDEINLAEPQILERLNSQLEKSPSIVLSENGGVSVRELNEREQQLHKEGNLPGVDPLNPNFRIFATMNPAEYSGRQPMSPAYKDRWTSYKFVNPSSAKDYIAMMELMIYGEQPEVTVYGQKYASEKTEALLRILAEVPGFRGFAAKLAKFQEAVEGLARRREIGKSKKEPYIFTRRGLIEFLFYLEGKTNIDRKTKKRVSIKDVPEMIITRAIQYYYLDKISNPDDLKKVKDQLDAIGISETNWTHKFK